MSRGFPLSDKKSGILYLVGTPIGHLGDMSFRAVEVLKKVDLVLCEDTRRSYKLFSRYEIKTRRFSYHDFNKERVTPGLIKRLESGESLALISDAGMPGISDPGYYIVRRCIDRGIAVTVIPGASAALSALVVSGLPPNRFVFEGFLPQKKAKRQRRLRELADEKRTMIFFISKYRLTDVISEMVEIFGNRKSVLCRELTKMHEEIIRGVLMDIAEAVRSGKSLGEYVLVVEGRAPESPSPPEK